MAESAAPIAAADALLPGGTTNPAASTPPADIGPPDPVVMLPRLNEQLDALEQQCDQRADILKGLE